MCLRIYDTELMRFSMEKQGLSGLVAEILYTNEEQAHLLPLDMERTGEGVIHWLERRVIPKNRAFVDEILKTLGLSHNDTKGIIDVCKGLSLNDSYWVVPEGFEGKFFQYNLYENRFSEILALVAYTGAGGSRQAFTTSPALTTGGMLPKAWRYVEHDGIYLYKGGTTGASNAGREPYCEYYASQIAETMRLNAVHYDLALLRLRGRLGRLELLIALEAPGRIVGYGELWIQRNGDFLVLGVIEYRCRCGLGRNLVCIGQQKLALHAHRFKPCALLQGIVLYLQALIQPLQPRRDGGEQGRAFAR